MFKIKTSLLVFFLTLLLFLFFVNSMYLGVYSLVDPFFYVYFPVTLMIMFSAVGTASAIPVSISAALAVIIFLSGYGFEKISGLPGAGVFGQSSLSFAVAVLIVTLFAVFILIPFIFSLMRFRGASPARSIYVPVSAVFFIIFIAAAIYLSGSKINMVSMSDDFSAIVTGKLTAAYGQMGMSYFTTPKMRGLISDLLKSLFFLLPGITVVFSWMGLWLSFISLTKLFGKTGNVFYAGGENLLLWKASDYFILLPIGGIIISIFSVGIYKFIGYNIILLSASVYLAQGLTIVAFFFNKFNVNIFIRILGYGIIFFFSNPVIIFVIMTGIFDMWFNLRKIEIKK